VTGWIIDIVEKHGKNIFWGILVIDKTQKYIVLLDLLESF